MKKVGLVLGALFVFSLIVVLCALAYYNKQIGPVSNSNKEIYFEVEQGSNYYSISDELYEKGLIKSEQFYKVYLKLNPPKVELKAGEYILKPNMGVTGIIDTFSGKALSHDISITFKEGKNMRDIAKIIAANTNNKEEDVFNLLKDQEYLKSLINEYWFIDESILNKDIYYSLEGYLFPNTYNFKSKDVTVKEIFKVLLDETNKQLTPLKDSIIKSKYSAHELITLASIVELEALNANDRKLVASVFYNRIKINMSLGSDVTTYYAAKINMGDRDLTRAELDDINAYNTRPISRGGKLPVGPICNPSLSSLKAVINPVNSDYYFFVADKNGKVYFTRNNTEHNQTIAKLKKEGLWYTY